MQNIIHANVPVSLLKLKKVPVGEIEIGERTQRIEGGMYKERSGDLPFFLPLYISDSGILKSAQTIMCVVPESPRSCISPTQ